MAVELATGYISLVPSARGLSSSLGRELQGPLTKAGGQAGDAASKSFGDRFSSGLRNAGKAAAVGFGVAATAAVAFGAKSADTFARVGGEVLKLQRFTGETAEAASRLRFAGLQAGLDVTSLTTSLGQLSKKAVGTSLDDLGLGLKNAAGKALPLNDQLLKIADVFKSMPNGAEKTALAMKLFGRSGAAMIPFLNRGAAGIAELEAQSDKLGNTLSGKDLDAVKESTKQHRLFSAAMDGLQVQVGRFVLPVMTKFTTFLASSMPVAIETARSAMERLATVVGPIFDTLDLGFEALRAALSGEGITSDGFVGVMERIGVAVRFVADVMTAVIPAAVDVLTGALRIAADGIRTAVDTIASTVEAALGSVPGLVFSDALQTAFSGATTAWSDYADAGIGPIADKLAAVKGAIERVSTVLSEQRDILIPAAAAAVAFGTAFAAYSAASSAIGAIESAAALLGPALSAAFAPLLANPAGLIIAGLVALGAALVTAYFKVQPFRDAVDSLFDVIKGAARIVGEFASELFTRALPVLQDFADAIVDIAQAITVGFTRGLRALGGIVQRNIVQPLRPLGRFISDEVLPAFEAFGDFMSALFARLSDVAGPTLKILRAEFELIAGVISDAAGPAFRILAAEVTAAFNVFKAVTETIVNVLAPVLGLAFDALAGAIDIAWGVIVGVIQVAFDTIEGIFDVLTGLLTGDFGKVWEGLVEIVGAPFRAFKDVVVNTFEEVIQFIGGVPARIGDFVTAIFGGAIDIATTLFEGISDIVTTTFDGIVEFVTGLPGRIASAAEGAWDGIAEGFEGVINFIIGAWNSLEFSIPAKKLPGPLPDFGGITIGVPDLEPVDFAMGGVVMARPGGTLGRLGEAGRDEAVVPLPPGFDISDGGLGGPLLGELHVTQMLGEDPVMTAMRELKRIQLLVG